MNTHKTGLAHAYRRCLTGDIACGNNVAAHWIVKPIWNGSVWTAPRSGKSAKQHSKTYRA
jgi:hypothetical protein